MVDQVLAREAAGSQAAGRPFLAEGGEWLQEVLALARRWFIMLTRERLNLVFSIAQPAIWLVFFGTAVERTIDETVIGTSDYVGFILPGVITFTIVGNGVASAMPLLFDKEGGYLDRLLSLPIARSSIIVGSGQILAILVVALLLGVGIEAGIGGILVILLAAALLTLAVTAACLGFAYFVKSHGDFFAVTGFITLPLLFMSNAFVPLDAMPDWMEVVARLNPLTYAIEAMRIVIIDGWEGSVATSLAILTLFAAGCLALGTWEFRRHTGERT
jgi:ABC-2 type transport system permease protein